MTDTYHPRECPVCHAEMRPQDFRAVKVGEIVTLVCLKCAPNYPVRSEMTVQEIQEWKERRRVEMSAKSGQLEEGADLDSPRTWGADHIADASKMVKPLKIEGDKPVEINGIGKP